MARRAIPTAGIAGPGMRSQHRVMVPPLLQMTPQWDLVDLFLLKPSGESSQSDTSEHILLAARRRWSDFSLVDSTS
jgi:hypothetical protein